MSVTGITAPVAQVCIAGGDGGGGGGADDPGLRAIVVGSGSPFFMRCSTKDGSALVSISR